MGEIPIPQEIATSNGERLFHTIQSKVADLVNQVLDKYPGAAFSSNDCAKHVYIGPRTFRFMIEGGRESLREIFIAENDHPEEFRLFNGIMSFRICRGLSYANRLELNVGKEFISLKEQLPIGDAFLSLEYQWNPDLDGFDLLKVSLGSATVIYLDKERLFPEGRHISIDAILNSTLDPENKLGGTRIPHISQITMFVSQSSI